MHSICSDNAFLRQHQESSILSNNRHLESKMVFFAGLKEFFHGSAHAQVLRNEICVPAWNKANFWGFTR